MEPSNQTPPSSEQQPFKVDPYAQSEAVIPDDVLRQIPIEDKRPVVEQLIENLSVSISTTEVKVTDHCVF